MALHTFANELFGLLGHRTSDESALRVLLEQEFKCLYSDHAQVRFSNPIFFFFHPSRIPFLKRFFFVQGVSLPPCLEDQLPCLPSSKLFKAASKIDFKSYQRKLVVGSRNSFVLFFFSGGGTIVQ